MKTFVKALALCAVVCHPSQSMNRMRMSNQQKNEIGLIVGMTAAFVATSVILYKWHIKSSLTQANAFVDNGQFFIATQLTSLLNSEEIIRYNYNTIQSYYNAYIVEKETLEKKLVKLKADIRSWVGYTDYKATEAGSLVKQLEERLTTLKNTLNHIEQNIIFPYELNAACKTYRQDFSNLLSKAGFNAVLEQQINTDYFGTNPDYPHSACLKSVEAAYDDLLKKEFKIIGENWAKPEALNLRTLLLSIKNSIINSNSYKEERKNFAALKRYEQERKDKKAHEDQLARIEKQKADALQTQATTDQQRLALDLKKFELETERLEHEKNTNNNSSVYPASSSRSRTPKKHGYEA